MKTKSHRTVKQIVDELNAEGLFRPITVVHLHYLLKTRDIPHVLLKPAFPSTYLFDHAAVGQIKKMIRENDHRKLEIATAREKRKT